MLIPNQQWERCQGEFLEAHLTRCHLGFSYAYNFRIAFTINSKSMTKNIIIFNNELCPFLFTGERNELFHLSWLSENEVFYASNSPEMTVLKSLAYRKSKLHLNRIAIEAVAEQIYRHIREDFTIKELGRESNTNDNVRLVLQVISHGKQIEEKFSLKEHGDSWIITEWEGGASKSFFESEEYQAVLSECKETYEPYRITKAYIEYQYKLSNIQWYDAFSFMGGKEVWGHHNKFIEYFWCKFPYQNLRALSYSEMELFNICVDDIFRAVALDDAQFDKAISNEHIPEYFYEYIQFFPIRRSIPKCSSAFDAIWYVNNLPYPDNVRMRWIENFPFREIHFSKSKEISSTFYRSECKIKRDKLIFKSPSRIAPIVSIGGKKVDITLCEE